MSQKIEIHLKNGLTFRTEERTGRFSLQGLVAQFYRSDDPVFRIRDGESTVYIPKESIAFLRETEESGAGS